MTVDLSLIDKEEFEMRSFALNGEKLTLVFPKQIGAHWNKYNMIFRSSVWNEAGEPVSLGFKKFFNFTEHPELTPEPTSVKKASVIEKIDGSLLIVSKYKGHLITRTRGTMDATKMEKNGHEVALLKEKYPKAFDNELLDKGFTLLYEWVSPLNIIVLPYLEMDIKLIGMIDHHDYSYADQKTLDELAIDLGVTRPKTYQFKDITDVTKAVEAFVGTEGVCLYFNEDQDIKKIKGLDYLARHRFKEKCNFESILDLFINEKCPDYTTFLAKLVKDFDHECMLMAQPYASQIINAYEEVVKLQQHMERFVAPYKADKTREARKTAAKHIIQAYGNTNRASFAFALLDGKAFDFEPANEEFNKESIKKLVYQVMKR